MKKALAHIPAPQAPVRNPFTRRARLAGGLTLFGLTAGLGFFASRPAYTAGGPIAVTVANAPLATTPTDEAAPQQPFTAQAVYLIKDGSEIGSIDTGDGYTDIAVPAGKRLVIQTTSLYHAENNKETVQAYINPTTHGAAFYYAFPSVPSNGTAYPGTTMPLAVYADPSSTVRFSIYRNQSAGDDVVILTVSGYLVNA